MTKRNMFDELMQGVEDLKLERTGKITLKQRYLKINRDQKLPPKKSFNFVKVYMCRGLFLPE